MNNGKVKWYDEVKGFGFFETENQKDVFVHRSGLDRPYDGLEPGQEVSYELKQGDKGLSAVNVRVVR